MTVVSSFEILAENLFPQNVLPPSTVNPYLVQGYFLEVSLNPEGNTSAATYNLIFSETTDFNQGQGQKALSAQIVEADGTVTLYSQFFNSVGRGFLNETISAGQTKMYGVQVIAPPPTQSGALPQSGTGWRGTVQLNVLSGGSGNLIATPTHRLVYFDGTNPTTSSVLDAVVYPVPTASGGTVI